MVSNLDVPAGGCTDGKIHIFGVTHGHGRLAQISQLAPNGGWGGFSTSKERGLLDIEVTRFADGRLHVAALDGNPGVWQGQKRGGWGNRWPTWGVTLGQPAIDSDADGRLPGRRARRRHLALITGGSQRCVRPWSPF